MKKTNRSSSRKREKDTGKKGKKGTDENEKLVTGAGWTAAATQHFVDLPTDEERLAHVMQMFNVAENDYKFTEKSTFLVDFNLQNGIICMESQYDASQMQFVCRTLSQMLDMVPAACAEGSPDFDKLNSDMLAFLRTQFDEFNAEEFHFTPDQTKDILKLAGSALLHPIRMIARLYTTERPIAQILYSPKMFVPPQPIPLAQFEEEFPLVEPELEFTPMELPPTNITLADVRDAIARYTDALVETIDKRYDALESRLSSLPS